MSKSTEPALQTFRAYVLLMTQVAVFVLLSCTSSNPRLEQLRHEHLVSNLDVASAAVAAGQFDAAKRLYLQIQGNYPEAPEPHLAFGNLSFALQEMNTARRAFIEAEKRSLEEDQRAQAELGLGRVALALGEPETAREHFFRAQSFAPYLAWASNGLGVAATIEGDHETASAHYRRAQDYGPQIPDFDANLIRSLVSEGRISEAAVLYQSRDGSYWRPEERESLGRLIEDHRESSSASPRTDSPSIEPSVQPDPQKDELEASPGEKSQQINIGVSVSSRPDPDEPFPVKPQEVGSDSMETTPTDQADLSGSDSASPVVNLPDQKELQEIVPASNVNPASAEPSKPSRSSDSEDQTVQKSEAGARSGQFPAVQIGAFRSSERALQGWRQLNKKNSDIFEGFDYDISRVDLGPGKGVYYRLKVGPLPSRRDAMIVCCLLANRGDGCLLTKLAKP